MNPRHYSIRLCSLFFFTVFFLSTIGALAAPGTKLQPVAVEKSAVIDGHVVHDVGELWSHVTNWGLIGSAPGATTPFSDAPSAMWPGGSGNEYLWAAGLWVGGTVLGEQRVSTGGFSSEFLPTEAPGDTIFATAHGAPGGNRFPWSDADDDGDGLEDEELLNGLDEDMDGLVDEDFAAIGDQHFVCGYNDFEPAILEIQPDHTPLNVKVIQQSIQWSNPLGEDFIGYDFMITNMGEVDIDQVYLGMFSDFDIGPRALPSIAADDYAGFVSTMVQASNGSWVSVQVAYMFDGAEIGAVDGYAGWVLCGHTTDPLGVTAPVEPGVLGFQRFAGQLTFAQGGDPTNDAERYELLSLDQWDPDVLPYLNADYRVLMSSGPFPSLAPGESITYQLALVLGAGLDGMIANAAEAVLAYRGLNFDRDGDPANGDEFTVNWLMEEDTPVAASAGYILAQMVADGVELLIETNLDPQDGLTVIRRPETDLAERFWTGSELVPAGSSGHNHLFRLLDTEKGGWPRVYDLVFEDSGRIQALDQVDLDLPRMAAIELSASPNPFNPRVNIHFVLPQAGKALLQIFDLRGHLVRTLLDEYRPMGSDTVFWLGDDESGRALASGVYQMRLATEEQLIEQRITLLR